jgi:hypothetical protein
MQATLSRDSNHLDRLLRLMLAAAVVAVFWPVCRAGFVSWDDPVNIVNNPHLGLGWEDLKWMFTDSSYVRRYLPLGWLSYTLDRVFFGGSPASYHVGNLLLHAVNTLLVYAILKSVIRRVVTDAKIAEIQSAGWGVAAAAGALWWAVNPLRAEPVAWASSRIYCVSALFFFLALWAYLRQESPSLVPRWRCTVGVAILCFGLSLFTYPVALGGLVVFLVLDFYPLRRLPPRPGQWWLPEYRRVWAEKFLFLIPVVIMCGVNLAARVNHPDLEPVVTLAQFSVASRVMQALWIWAWYLWKPWQPFDLAPKYPDLLTDLPFTPAHLLAAVLVVTVSSVLFLRRRVWPGLAVLWLCHLALLLPLLGFTEHPHHTFDRYGYIVGTVWAALVAGTVLVLLQREKLRLPVMTAMALLCCFFGWLAREQSLVWNNSLSVQVRMAESLGNHPQRVSHDVVIATLLLEARQFEDAVLALRPAIALRPDMPEAWGAFGDALAGQQRLEPAVASYQRALALNPHLYSARQNLGVTLAMAGRQEEAVAQFTELLRQRPADASARYNLELSLKRLGREGDPKR